MVLAYLGWRTDMVISTVTVLSRASETTTPVRTLRALRSATGLALLLPEVGLDLLLAHHRGNAGHLAPEVAHSRRLVQLVGRQLKAQVEKLLLGLGQPLRQLVVREVAQVGRLHSSSRLTNLVLMGSLCPAT